MVPRFLVINRTLAGRTVLELLRSHFHLQPRDVHQLLKHNGIRLAGAVCRDLTWRMRTGQKLHVEAPASKPAVKGPRADSRRQPPEPAGSSGRGKRNARQKIHIEYIDDHILVVEKPAGLTTVRHATERAAYSKRAQRFLPATLLDLLSVQMSGKQPHGRLRAVHRLDKETSGLIVLARSPEAERGFGLQFRQHDVGRTYLALVRGRAREGTVTSFLVRDRGDGRRGSSDKLRTSGSDKGQKAITHVHVVEEFADFTLVECRLETGRTHQVRIHLAEQGTPLCGEQVYDRPLHGLPTPDISGASRPALHAATLAFEHPITKKHLKFASPMPADMNELLKSWRKK